MKEATSNQNQESGRNLYSYRQVLIRLSFLCLLVGVLFLSFFTWYFWSNAGYTNDRYAVLSAMAKLHFMNQQVVSVGGRRDIVLVKTRPGYQKVFDNYMKNLGWKYVDRMGAAVYFRKGKQEMRVTDGALTAYFRIHGLGCNPYKIKSD